MQKVDKLSPREYLFLQKSKRNNSWHYEHICEGKFKRWESALTDKYKQYRLEWKDNPRKFIVKDGPLHIDIEVTNCCNIACVMCPRTQLKKLNTFRKEEYISNDLCFKILDLASELGVYSVKFNFLGEPTMHKNLVEYVNYAKAKGFVEIMINTNSVCLTEKLSSGLLKAGLNNITFSFESLNCGDYEKVRKGARFEEVINNIKTFIALKEEYNLYNVKTKVSTLHRSKDSVIGTEFHEKDKYIKDFINFWSEYVEVVGIANCLDYNYLVGYLTGEEINFRYNKNFICPQIWQRLLILVDGSVLACCEDPLSKGVLANIKDTDLYKIWKGAKLTAIRKLHIERRYNEMSQCKNCFMPASFQ